MFDWNRSCSYDGEQKRRFHTTARSRLKKLAAELALPPGSYDLRSNKAGIAVSGEVTLHNDRAYIQVGQFGLSSGHGILIRTCNGRKDYTGGPNHFVALTMLDDIPALAAAVRAIEIDVEAEDGDQALEEVSSGAVDTPQFDDPRWLTGWDLQNEEVEPA